MSSFEFHSQSEEATRKFGKQLGEAITAPMVIFLSGTLGAGKTRLVQAIAVGLGIDSANVQSPTFTLMTPHEGRLTLVHVDAYRISDADEADQLGLDDWVESGCVLIVEWAERIQNALPEPDLQISIEHVSETTRLFSTVSNSTRGGQILRHIQHNVT